MLNSCQAMPASLFGGRIHIAQAGFRQTVAHRVQVEAQLACRQPFAYTGFLGLALLRRLRDGLGACTWYDNHTVVVTDDHVAWMDQRPGADDRYVDRPQRRLDGPFGGHRARPHWKMNARELLRIAATGVDDEPLAAMRAEGGRQQFAEHAILVVAGQRDHHHIARANLFSGDVEHPIVTRMRQHRERGSAYACTGVDGPHVWPQ